MGRGIEDRAFQILVHVLHNMISTGGELRPIRPTVQEALSNP